MDRRSFLKSAIAAGTALLVPTWLGQPAKATLNLQAFCVPYKQSKHAKFYMQNPFTQDTPAGLMSYGTDGKICVRNRSLLEIPHEGEIKCPPSHRLDWRHDSERGWKPWPKVDYIEDAQANCIHCRGTGGGDRNQDCAECDGNGQIWTGEDFMAYPKPCPTCNGCGNAGPYCLACKGKQYVHGPDKQPLGHLHIAADMDNLVRRECGDAEYVIIHGYVAKHSRSNERVQTDLVLFRFAAGDGILCPLNAAQ